MEKFMIPDTSEEMLSAEFWINKLHDVDRVIMKLDEIEKFNQSNTEKVSEVYNLRSYKDKLSKEELKTFLMEYSIPEKARYDASGNEIQVSFYDEIIENTNIDGISEINEIKYGITVKNTSLRSFPTLVGVFSASEDIEFDRFQETGCQAVEPVLVLHESKDREWYFIQMYNYRGWVRASDIALAKNSEEVFNYMDSKDYIVITGDFVYTQFNPYEEGVSYQRLEMGTRIPLAEDSTLTIGNQSILGNYVVKYPVRNSNGGLEIKHCLISKKQDISIGYLSYTSENILKQVFKLFGHRYGWGDGLNGRDCSSTLMYVYKTFGFRLPRNGGEQERGAGISYRFSENDNIEDRVKIFNKVLPGAGIYMPGHVMMYIGCHKEAPYMIHCFHGYGEKVGDEYRFRAVNEVAVTSTLLTTSSGNIFINKFSSILQIQ